MRSVLGLSVDQLGDLTRALSLDVGPRANYPRYTRDAVHRLAAVIALRDLNAPLWEVAARVAEIHSPALLAGRGWIAAVPVNDRWTLLVAAAAEDLVSLLALGGKGYVLDLAHLSSRVDVLWRQTPPVSA